MRIKVVCLTAIVGVVGVGGAIRAYNIINDAKAKTEVVSTTAPGVEAAQQPEVVIEKSVIADEKSVVSEDGKTRVGFHLSLTMPK
jgi:hypothetical protein